ASLVAQYGSRNVGIEANGYPAVPVVDPWLHQPDPWYLLHDYKPSVNRGVTDAVADITAYAHRCASGYHKLVIAGYSQGADVVRRALARISSQTYSSTLSVQVTIYGDPNFNPAEDITFGSGGIDENGSFRQVIGVGR